jgi:hypothetical protein
VDRATELTSAVLCHRKTPASGCNPMLLFGRNEDAAASINCKLGRAGVLSRLLVEERHARDFGLIEIGGKQRDTDLSLVEAIAMQGPSSN